MVNFSIVAELQQSHCRIQNDTCRGVNVIMHSSVSEVKRVKMCFDLMIYWHELKHIFLSSFLLNYLIKCVFTNHIIWNILKKKNDYELKHRLLS